MVFNRGEAALACCYLVSHGDAKADQEDGFIKNKINNLFKLQKLSWSNFYAKWNDTGPKYATIEKMAIDTLKNCTYVIREKACASMLGVVRADKDLTNREWDVYWRILTSLDVGHEDASDYCDKYIQRW